MDYEEIGEIIGEIKFHYVETGEWDAVQCAKLLNLTQHVPLMVGRKRGVDFDDLNDIVQQTYHAAFKHIRLLSDDRAFPKYLYTIADNLCRKYWKNRLKMGHQESLDDPDAHSKALEPSAADQDQMRIRENLREAIVQLPAIYRETIEMHYFAGMKAFEIADTLHISINTVTSRIRRGRMILKDLLEA